MGLLEPFTERARHHLPAIRGNAKMYILQNHTTGSKPFVTTSDTLTELFAQNLPNVLHEWTDSYRFLTSFLAEYNALTGSSLALHFLRKDCEVCGV